MKQQFSAKGGSASGGKKFMSFVFMFVNKIKSFKFSRSAKNKLRLNVLRTQKYSFQFAKSRVAMGSLLTLLLLVGGASILEHVLTARAISTYILQNDYTGGSGSSTTTTLVGHAQYDTGANIEGTFQGASTTSSIQDQADASNPIVPPTPPPNGINMTCGQGVVGADVLIGKNHIFTQRFAVYQTIAGTCNIATYPSYEGIVWNTDTSSEVEAFNTLYNPLVTSVTSNRVGDGCLTVDGAVRCYNNDGTITSGNAGCSPVSAVPDSIGGAHLYGACLPGSYQYMDDTGTVSGSGPFPQNSIAEYNNGIISVQRDGQTFRIYDNANVLLNTRTIPDFDSVVLVDGTGKFIYRDNSGTDITLHFYDAASDTAGGSAPSLIGTVSATPYTVIDGQASADGYRLIWEVDADTLGFQKIELNGSFAASSTIELLSGFSEAKLISERGLFVRSSGGVMVAYDQLGNLTFPDHGYGYSGVFMAVPMSGGLNLDDIFVSVGGEGYISKLHFPTYQLTGQLVSSAFDTNHETQYSTISINRMSLVNSSTSDLSVQFSNDLQQWTPVAGVTDGVDLATITDGIGYRYFRYIVDFVNSDIYHSDYLQTVSVNPITYAAPAIYGSGIRPVNESTGRYFGILGEGFGYVRGTSTVKIDGVDLTSPSTNYVSWSDNYIVFKVPTGTSVGTKAITVNVPNSSPSLSNSVNVDVSVSSTVTLTDSAGAAQATFNSGDTIYILVNDPNLAGDPSVDVTLTTPINDSLTVTLYPCPSSLVAACASPSGKFFTANAGGTALTPVTLVSSSTPDTGNSIIEAEDFTQITATYTNNSALAHKFFFQQDWTGGVDTATTTTAEVTGTTYASLSDIYVKNNSVTLAKDDLNNNFGGAIGTSLITSFSAAPVTHTHQIADGVGGSIIAFSILGNIYGQRVDADGTFLWGASPITLYSIGDATDFNIALNPDKSSFYFAVEGGNVIRKHSVADGSMLLSAGAGVLTMNEYNNGIVVDTAGNVFVSAGTGVDIFSSYTLVQAGTTGAFLGLPADFQIVAGTSATAYVCFPQFTSQIYCNLILWNGSIINSTPNTDGDNTYGWKAASDGNNGLLISYIITGVTGCNCSNQPAIYRYYYDNGSIVVGFHALLSDAADSSVVAPNVQYDSVSGKIYYVIPTSATATKILSSDLLGNFDKATQSTITISNLNSGGTSELVTAASGTDIALDITYNNARNLDTDSLGGIFVAGNCVNIAPFQCVARLDQESNIQYIKNNAHGLNSAIRIETLIRTRGEEVMLTYGSGDPLNTINALRVQKISPQFVSSGTLTSLKYDAGSAVNFTDATAVFQGLTASNTTGYSLAYNFYDSSNVFSGTQSFGPYTNSGIFNGSLGVAGTNQRFANYTVTMTTSDLSVSPELIFSTIHTSDTIVDTAFAGGLPDLYISNPEVDANWVKTSIEAIDWVKGDGAIRYVRIGWTDAADDCDPTTSTAYNTGLIVDDLPNTGRYLWTIPANAGGATGTVANQYLCVADANSNVTFQKSAGELQFVDSTKSVFDFDAGSYTLSDDTQMDIIDGKVQLISQSLGAPTASSLVEFTSANSNLFRTISGTADYLTVAGQLQVGTVTGVGTSNVNPQFSVGEMWLPTNSGPYRTTVADPNTQIADAGISGLSGPYAIDSTGVVWISAGGTLQRVVPGSPSIATPVTVTAGAPFGIQTIAIGEDDSIWLSGWNDCGSGCYDFGMVKIDATDNSTQVFQSYGLNQAITPCNPGSGCVFSMAGTKSGTMVASGLFSGKLFVANSTNTSLSILDTANGATFPPGEFNAPFGVFTDTNDDVWVVVTQTNFVDTFSNPQIFRIIDLSTTPVIAQAMTVSAGTVLTDVSYDVNTNQLMITANVGFADSHFIFCTPSGNTCTVTGDITLESGGFRFLNIDVDLNGLPWTTSSSGNFFSIDSQSTFTLYALGLIGSPSFADFTGYQNTIITNVSNVPDVYDSAAAVVATSQFNQVDTSQWGDLDATPFTFNGVVPGGTSIKVLASFDGKSTDDATKIWNYYTGSAWATSDIADTALNGNAIADVTAYTAADWKATGGFVIGQTPAIDLAFALTADPSGAAPGNATPSIQDFQFSYLPAVYIPNPSEPGYNSSLHHPTITSTSAVTFSAASPLNVFSTYHGVDNHGTFKFKLNTDNGDPSAWWWYNTLSTAWEATTVGGGPGSAPAVDTSGPGTAPATTGAIAYWNFDGNLLDTSTSGLNDGTEVNGPVFFTGGNFAYSSDQSLLFRGGLGTQAVDVGTLPGLGSSINSSSYVFWYKSVSTASQILFGGSETLVGDGHIQTVAVALNSDALTGANEPGKLSFVIKSENPGPELRYFTESTNTLDLNSPGWHQVVVTFDNLIPQAKLYFDGEPVADTPAVADQISDFREFTNSLAIGSFNVNGSPAFGTFDGRIDNVIIYDSVLSASQILSDYTAGLSGTQEAYWAFDQGATATDSAHNNTLSLINGATNALDGNFGYGTDQSLDLTPASSQYADASTLGNYGSRIGLNSFEMWYKADPGSTGGYLFGVSEHQDAGAGVSGTQSLQFRIISGFDAFVFGAIVPFSNDPFGIGGGIDGGAVSGGSASWDDGQWHMLAVTYDALNASGKIYFDGQIVSGAGSFVDAKQFFNFDNSITIGAFNNDSTDDSVANGVPEGFFDGQIDNVIFYRDTLLSASDVLADYNAGLTSTGIDQASLAVDINANIDTFASTACPTGTCNLIWKAFVTAGSLAQLDNINIGSGTPPPTPPSGGGGPSAPSNLIQQDPYAIDATSIRWVFDNINSGPISVRLYETNSSNQILDTGTTTFNAGTGLFVDETGLQPNTKYESRYVTAFDGNRESGSDGYYPAVYTLANPPSAPTYSNQTDTTVQLNFTANGNPVGTLMAIKDLISGLYVQADGSLGINPVYLPFNTGWNNGAVTVTGLTTGTQYQFALSAQNGEGQDQTVDNIIDGINTTFDLATGFVLTAGPYTPVTLRKGVQLIPSNSLVRGVSVAGVADKAVMNSTTTLNAAKSVATVNQLLNILLAILIALFIFSLLTIFKSFDGLNIGENKFFLIPKVLKSEASEFFGEYSTKMANGTHEYSYAHHKRLHTLSRTSLFSGAGLLALKVGLVMVVALFGANLKRSIASEYCFTNCDQVYPTVYPGDSLSYYVEYTNNTDQVITPAVIIDALDADTSYSSLSAVQNGTVDTTAVAGQGITPSVRGNVLGFDLGSVPARGTGFITFNVVINSTAKGSISNQATLNGQLQASAAGGPVTASSNLVSLTLSPLPCTTDTWTCSGWSACSEGGSQTRTCSLTFDCPADTTTQSPEISQSCTPVVPPIVPPVEPTEPTTPTEPTEPGTTPTEPGTTPTEPGTTPTEPGTTPGTITPGTTEDGTVIGSIVESLSFLGRLDDWLDRLIPELNAPAVEKSIEQVITPILLGLSAAITIPAFIAGAFNVLPYLHLLFLEPLMAFFGKRRNKYGVVYNALTKVPVDLAVIRIYDAKTKKLVATKITDKLGRFYMLSKVGEYYLAVTKPGFIYPTVYLKDDIQDNKFMDVYHGEKIEVTADGTPITVSIPLDPKEKVAHQESAEVRKFLVAKFKAFVPVSGMVLAIVGTIIYPTLLMFAFLALHIGLYFTFRRIAQTRRPKSWGVVYDEKSKKPIGNAVVRIFDTRFNKLLETYVTDGSGRYNFLVGPNQYQVMGVKNGYMDYKTKSLDLTKVESSEAIVAEDFGLQKGAVQEMVGVDIPLKRQDFAEPTNPTMHIESEMPEAPAQPEHHHEEISDPKEVGKIDLGNL